MSVVSAINGNEKQVNDDPGDSDGKSNMVGFLRLIQLSAYA